MILHGLIIAHLFPVVFGVADVRNDLGTNLVQICHLLNPMVADVLDCWIRMRRMRIKEVEEAKAKFELLKQEVADLH